MPTLRDYQIESANSVEREWEEVVTTLGLCATGGGKTAIAAEIIRRRQPGRAIFICHREELVFQARSTIQRFTGLECGIEMAENYVSESLFGDTPVVIATVQTLNAKFGDRTRMSRLRPSEFKTLIADEFHHFCAPSFKNVLNYFKQNPKLRILGLTATGDRGDELSLGQVCDTVAFDLEILDLIDMGFLVPVDQQFVNTSIDWSGIRTTCGDLNGADLAAVMEAESNMQEVAGASIQIIGNRRAIVFTASVKQAEVIANIFNRHRTGMADWVCGATNRDQRRELLSRFQSGEIQVMCNCGVLTEGFDDPGVEVIIMARPTKSRALYAQMAGRSTRPLPGIVDGLNTDDERKAAIAASPKPSCLIVDFVGNSGKHKLMSSADILGGKVSDDALERAVAKAEKLGKPVRMAELLEEEEEKVRELAEQARQREEARKARLVAKVKYSAKSINPFDVFDIQPVRERGWDNGRTLSEKQRALLSRQGVDPDTLPYAQGRQVLNTMFDRWKKKLCTLKQADLLTKHGIECKDMTMDRASKIITAIANNGWKRPDNLGALLPVQGEQSPF